VTLLPAVALVSTWAALVTGLVALGLATFLAGRHPVQNVAVQLLPKSRGLVLQPAQGLRSTFRARAIGGYSTAASTSGTLTVALTHQDESAVFDQLNHEAATTLREHFLVERSGRGIVPFTLEHGGGVAAFAHRALILVTVLAFALLLGTTPSSAVFSTPVALGVAAWACRSAERSRRCRRSLFLSPGGVSFYELGGRRDIPYGAIAVAEVIAQKHVHLVLRDGELVFVRADAMTSEQARALQAQLHNAMARTRSFEDVTALAEIEMLQRKSDESRAAWRARIDALPVAESSYRQAGVRLETLEAALTDPDITADLRRVIARKLVVAEPAARQRVVELAERMGNDDERLRFLQELEGVEARQTT
jgi:ribosomal protein S11